MNWLLVLSKIKDLNLKEVFVVIAISLASYLVYELNAAEAQVSALQLKVQELTLVKKSAELESFSNTLDIIMCEQSMKDIQSKIRAVNKGVTTIRSSKSPTLEQSIPVDLIKTLNQTREEQLK